MSVATEPRALHDLETAWAEQIPEEQWSVYRNVIDEASARGLPFLLGGAFGFAGYTGHWRNTKDLDFFILPRDRDRAVALLSDLGLEDYYDRLPYERHWIYRGVLGDVIVDMIWQMANRRAQVDESWFEDAPVIDLRGREVRILTPEELVWTKIYVMQRDRCDWPDLFNVFHTAGPEMDWDRMLWRLEADAPLLVGALTVFAWLCPGRARQFPRWLWERLGMPHPRPGPECTEDHRRVDLLDTRNWFGPSLRPGEPLATCQSSP